RRAGRTLSQRRCGRRPRPARRPPGPGRSPPEARPASVANMSDSAQQTDGATAVSEASRHLDIIIERPWRAVYEFASDPRNLPRWAAGLAGGEVQREVS